MERMVEDLVAHWAASRAQLQQRMLQLAVNRNRKFVEGVCDRLEWARSKHVSSLQADLLLSMPAAAPLFCLSLEVSTHTPET